METGFKALLVLEHISVDLANIIIEYTDDVMSDDIYSKALFWYLSFYPDSDNINQKLPYNITESNRIFSFYTLKIFQWELY